MIKQFVTSSYCLKCHGCCRFYKKTSAWSPHLSDKDIENLLKNNIAPDIISSHKTIKLRRLSSATPPRNGVANESSRLNELSRPFERYSFTYGSRKL